MLNIKQFFFIINTVISSDQNKKLEYPELKRSKTLDLNSQKLTQLESLSVANNEESTSDLENQNEDLNAENSDSTRFDDDIETNNPLKDFERNLSELNKAFQVGDNLKLILKDESETLSEFTENFKKFYEIINKSEEDIMEFRKKSKVNFLKGVKKGFKNSDKEKKFVDPKYLFEESFGDIEFYYLFRNWFYKKYLLLPILECFENNEEKKMKTLLYFYYDNLQAEKLIRSTYLFKFIFDESKGKDRSLSIGKFMEGARKLNEKSKVGFKVVGYFKSIKLDETMVAYYIFKNDGMLEAYKEKFGKELELNKKFQNKLDNIKGEVFADLYGEKGKYIFDDGSFRFIIYEN